MDSHCTFRIFQPVRRWVGMLSGRVWSRDGYLCRLVLFFFLVLVWVGVLSGRVPFPGQVPTHTFGSQGTGCNTTWSIGYVCNSLPL